MLPSELIDDIKDLEQTDYHETALGKSEVISPRQTKVMWKNAMPDERETMLIYIRVIVRVCDHKLIC